MRMISDVESLGLKADDARKGANAAKRASQLHGVFRWPLIECCIRKRQIAPIPKCAGPEHPAGRPTVAGLRAAWRGKEQIPHPLREFGMTTENQRRLSVRQHAPDLWRIGRIDLHRSPQMAHALRLLRPQQMALERVRAHDFPRFRDVEALRRAAMSFQLANFWLSF
jgi:hypothetical protein